MGEALPTILPAECVLTWQERTIVYNTLVPDEFPCQGCFKSKECPIDGNTGFAVAQGLGADLMPGGIKCPRCGGQVIQWAIRGQFRIWKCLAITEFSTYCGWVKEELGIPFEKYG